jgi:hypothetical protein
MEDSVYAYRKCFNPVLAETGETCFSFIVLQPRQALRHGETRETKESEGC